MSFSAIIVHVVNFVNKVSGITAPSGPVIIWHFFIIDMSDYKRRNDAVPKIRSIPAGGNRIRSDKDRYGSFFVPEKSAVWQKMISQNGPRKDGKMK